MKLKVFTVIMLCALVYSNESYAQDWWGKAKNILGSNTSKETAKSITNPDISDLAVSNLAVDEIGEGLREALRIGSEKVADQLGTKDGFNLDPRIHIPLPSKLVNVDAALSTVGLGALTDDLELKLNRAAELATPKAKDLFITAISQMTIDDAKNILSGPDDAATQYLKQTMGSSLETEMLPIVDEALASAGAINAYDQAMGKYGQIPFMPNVKENLNNYVVGKAMDGIFYYVAQEEAAIRTNPAKRTTDLLQRVFSSQ